MLTPLVWISGSTVSIMLVVVAGCAGYLSLWLSYQDLSARGDWAVSRVERVLRNNEVTGRNADVRSLLDGFDVDPDILAFFVSDKAGRELYSHRSASDELGARAANLLRGSKEPTSNADFVIVSQALEGAGAAKRATFAYDIRPAQRKALLELWFYGVGGILALLVALPVLLFMFRRQMIPMRHLTEIMSEMADENYGSVVSGQDRADEIGTIARAIHACRERLVDRERLRAIADEDIQRSSERHASMGRRVDTFRSTIGSSLREVAGLSDQMQVAADSLASIAKQTTARAESAVSAIGRTSANVSEVADASESLSASIREIEKQAEQTRGIVTAASRSALEMNSLIKGLYAKSETIDEIIVLIQAIAAQTNMLSLNATIEAARAGESGRGFAVVAQEVKSLADQTAQASQHVAEHVRSIQKAALQAVQAMTTIDATMAQADRFSAIIVEAVELQSGASVSISQSAAHAAKSAAEAAETMRRLAATIGETDQSAAQVHRSATDVGQQASDLSTTIDGFLSDTISLRAAPAQQRIARA